MEENEVISAQLAIYVIVGIFIVFLLFMIVKAINDRFK